MRFPQSRAAVASALAVTVLALSAAAPPVADKKTRPSVSVKANPSTGFAPTRVVLTAELKGGVNDYQEFYCPTVEWYWGDDTRAQDSLDCEPYQAGKSEIKRRYVFDRIFQTPGEFRVEFRLKQKDKVVGMGSTLVRIRPGLRDGGQ